MQHALTLAVVHLRRGPLAMFLANRNRIYHLCSKESTGKQCELQDAIQPRPQ
jgi:hypothetical protein